MYSFGTYVRLSDWTRCSSISRASLRAISTGRTSDLKARENVPSTSPASFDSRFRSTLIAEYPFACGTSMVARAYAVSATGSGGAGRASCASATAAAPATTAPRHEAVRLGLADALAEPFAERDRRRAHARRPGARGDQVGAERAPADQPREHDRRHGPDDGEQQHPGAGKRGDHVPGGDPRRRGEVRRAPGSPRPARTRSARSSSGSARTSHHAPRAPSASRALQRGARPASAG